MSFSNFITGFVLLFVIAFIVAAIVSYLYSLIAHGVGEFDWETSFRLAIILGIIVPLSRALEWKSKKD